MVGKICRSNVKDDKLDIVSKDKKSAFIYLLFDYNEACNTKCLFHQKIFHAFLCVTLYFETLLTPMKKGS